MLGYPCPVCSVLFAEMHSAITEVNSLVSQLLAMNHANLPGRNFNDWRQTTGAWEDAGRYRHQMRSEANSAAIAKYLQSWIERNVR